MALVVAGIGTVALLGGCGSDPGLLRVEMEIYRARIEAVTDTTADVVWDTNIPGDSRVHFGLVGAAATGAGEVESISDEQYIPLGNKGPLFDGGGVTIAADFEHVSNTRYHRAFVRNHRVVLDDLLPARTYVATVYSNNNSGSEAHEFGVTLRFTTNAAAGSVDALAETTSP